MRAAALIPLAAALTVAACGTMDGDVSNSYASEQRKLSDDCVARGGILTPTGSHTNHPAADYACRVTGPGASRIQNN